MWSLTLDRRRAASFLGPDGLWDGRRHHPDWRSWRNAAGTGRCCLWLAGSMVHDLVADPTLGLDDPADVAAWARAQWTHYHGAAARDWPIATWSARGRRGASALHGVDLRALQAQAGTAQVTLVSVRPWWTQVLALCLARPDGVGRGSKQLLVLEGSHAVQVTLRGGRVETVRHRRLDHATAAEVSALVAEQAPPEATYAVGYGMADQAIAGVEVLAPLNDTSPPAAWVGSVIDPATGARP